MPELEKAFLEIEGGEKVPCLFNPSSISVGRRNNWAADPMPGKGVPQLRYTGAGPGWMSLDLMFDTTGDGTPVTRHTGKILALMDIDPSLPGSDEASHNARPPTVTFHWGDLHSFPAVVRDLGLTFTYFSSGGVPLRAQMHLDLRQYEPSKAFGPAEPDLGHPEAAPRPPRPARRDPRPDLGPVLRRLDAVAQAGAGQRCRGPALVATRHAAGHPPGG